MDSSLHGSQDGRQKRARKKKQKKATESATSARSQVYISLSTVARDGTSRFIIVIIIIFFFSCSSASTTPSVRRPPDNIWVIVIVWNIIRTAVCWIVWHNVHSQQHTYKSSSYRSNRILGFSHCDPYAVHRGGCLELYYCSMEVDWFWWDSSLISTTNWFPSVLWHCWFGHLACKNRPRNDEMCWVGR